MLHLALVAALAATPTETPLPTAKRLLGAIRAQFRTHRPPPAFEIYTLERRQLTDQGFTDYVGSYKVKYWVRNLDRAALTRRIFRSINRGELLFDRPAFNEDRDPGPPTADLFEPAPAHPHPLSFVPTPEPAGSGAPLPTIGVVTATGEFDYDVTSVEIEGTELHLTLLPTRDPDRNRLRELWVDKKTLELHKLIATDKLFLLPSKDVYGVLFTVTLKTIDNVPCVTSIHGVVGDGYSGDGQVVDYVFSDISFPASLPSWYFDSKTYPQHDADAPT